MDLTLFTHVPALGRDGQWNTTRTSPGESAESGTAGAPLGDIGHISQLLCVMEPLSRSLERHRVPPSEGSGFSFSAVKINIDARFILISAKRPLGLGLGAFQSFRVRLVACAGTNECPKNIFEKFQRQRQPLFYSMYSLNH